MAKKFLTKSKFKMAHGCPVKVYYFEHKEYGNTNEHNEFLEALAQGGFQVGALAKLYYPGGIDLEGLKSEEAIERTSELLKQDRVVIFEAALSYGDYLVRVDILEKNGNEISLIEVKAKSYTFDREDFFKEGRRGESKSIISDWAPYLVDIAFQTHVAHLQFPNNKISSFLMMADKTAIATVNGLHQKFLISKRDGRIKIIVKDQMTQKDLGEPILKAVNVDQECAFLIQNAKYPGGKSLRDYAKSLAAWLNADKKADVTLGGFCKKCEFRIGQDLKSEGLKSGFEQCWIEQKKIKPSEVGRKLVFDIWNLKNADAYLDDNKIFMDQIVEKDLKPDKKCKKVKEGLEVWERQWIQVQHSKSQEERPYIDKEGIREFLGKLKYPLHFIDFETTTSAIPFHHGRRPYEQIAFQFCHHVMSKEGGVRHQDQFIHMERGEFPNFDFVRALRKALIKDEGTIFRFADHENTVLRHILRQIEATPPEDAEELKAFIRLITRPTGKEQNETEGQRVMVDLKKAILDYYYHPMMGGSNSIKKVSPAILHDSEILRSKYSKPIYGKGKEISSLNFSEMVWIQTNDRGEVKDPYKLLPPVFTDVDMKEFREDRPLIDDESIDDGGAAMTAWARMQFTEMKEPERRAIEAALLKYCELDTLSMVWIIEYFKSISRK